MRHAIPHYDDPSTEAAFQEHEDRLEGAGRCVFCHHPVDVTDFRRILGWVHGRSGDGLIRDGSVDEWAHRHCILRHKAVGDGQAAFNV